MFVKKDLRKVPEILKDHYDNKNKRGGDHDDGDDEPSTTTMNLHLSKRASEFRGSIRVLVDPPRRLLLNRRVGVGGAGNDGEDGDKDGADDEESNFELLRDVASLSLYDCAIRDIRGISKLSNLVDLCLGRNPITHLGDAGKLRHLKRLWLDDCQLGATTGTATTDDVKGSSIDEDAATAGVALVDGSNCIDCLMSLTSLEELRISNNQIAALPEDIGDKLPNLKVLSVDHNMLTSLPESIGKLKRLEILQVRQNRLTALPDPLPTESLRVLHASSNGIRELPPKLLSECCQLTHLYLNSNAIEDVLDGSILPERNSSSNKYPSKLQRVNLANNKIDFVPKSWYDCVDDGSGICALPKETERGGEGNNNDDVVTVVLRDNPILDDIGALRMMQVE